MIRKLDFQNFLQDVEHRNHLSIPDVRQTVMDCNVLLSSKMSQIGEKFFPVDKFVFSFL